MAFDVTANVVLEVHPDCLPDEADWDAFIAWLPQQDVPRRLGGIVMAEGPGPNAGQRKKLLAVPGMDKGRSVVLTTSVLARGAITALNWLGYKGLVGRDYADLRGCFDHLGVPQQDRSLILKRLIELKCELLGLDARELLQIHDHWSLAGMRLATMAAVDPRVTAQRRRSDAA
jgi:hypothetical protein